MATASFDLITAYHIKRGNGEYDLFPSLDRAMLADQVPSIKKKYLLSADFAKENMKGLLSNLNTKDMLVKTCETTASVWIENKGNGKFVQHALPLAAQLAPINSIVARDLDADGVTDLLLAGNEYSTEYSTGRYDAGYGTFLKGTGKGTFVVVPSALSGFVIDGDVRSLNTIMIKNQETILAAVNNDKLKSFALQRKNR
jgi:hypothetical protein